MEVEGRYYVVKFDRDDRGDIIRQDLFSSPNGTCLDICPIHINTRKDTSVTWGRDGVEKHIDLTGLTIIPTNETNRISVDMIAKGLGLSTADITRSNRLINTFLVNIFKDYVPELDLN